jgi:hypothetical protein
MFEGMRDSGIDMRIPWLDRELTADDLLVQNHAYLVILYPMSQRPTLAESATSFMCSSAVFWADWTDNDELDGALIHGKNMDGEIDLRKVTVNSLLILAIEPPDDSGKNRIVAVDWPGLYGTNNGLNEHGLYLAPHSVITIPDFEATNLLEYCVWYREILMDCSSLGDVQDYWNSVAITHTGGFNTTVSAPYFELTSGYPAVTYESDSYGYAIREPMDFTPMDPSCLLTTNYFFKYSGANPDAVLPFGNYRSQLEADNYRYQAMLDLLAQYANEGRTVATPEMIEILQTVSKTQAYSGYTEYSFICYPDTRSFALAKEDLKNRVLDASFAEFTTYSFEELFH